MQGIVFKTLDYKENDKLVYLFTENGLISLKVKKAKVYKAANYSFCNLLTCSEFTFSEGLIKTLNDFNIINNFYNIKNNYYKLLISINILELASLEHQINITRLYQYIYKSLEYLNENNNYLDVYFIFLVKMLKIFGILFDFNKIKDSSFKIFGNKSTLEYSLLLDKAYNSKMIINLDVNNDDILSLICFYESCGFNYFDKIKNIFKV